MIMNAHTIRKLTTSGRITGTPLVSGGPPAAASRYQQEHCRGTPAMSTRAWPLAVPDGRKIHPVSKHRADQGTHTNASSAPPLLSFNVTRCRCAPVGHVGPGCPRGPGGPGTCDAAPAGPGGPCIDFPGTPWGPGTFDAAPVAPVAPTTLRPGGPWGPMSPGTPTVVLPGGPCIDFPGTPWGPGGPGGPVWWRPSAIAPKNAEVANSEMPSNNSHGIAPRIRCSCSSAASRSASARVADNCSSQSLLPRRRARTKAA